MRFEPIQLKMLIINFLKLVSFLRQKIVLIESLVLPQVKH